MTKTVLVLIAIFAIACGSGGYSNLDEAIAGENCDVAIESDAMFATDEIYCEDGSLISWHANEQNRDAYAEIIEDLLGAVPSEQGERYNVYRDIDLPGY